MEELTLVDTEDRVIGSMEKAQAHTKPVLHRAFSVFLYDGDRMLLQKRHRDKYHSGGLWTNACCSHPRFGESLEEAVPRRLREEVGCAPEVREIFDFIYCAKFREDLWEYEYDHVYLGRCTEPFRFDPQEAEDSVWMPMAELRRQLVEEPCKFTPWFLIAAPRVLDFLSQFQENRGNQS